ncbi:hypothetical protein C0991_008889, partial [Blastosporella zonata]
NPDYLIQFLLFITCANATQLGYDPMVEHVLDSGEVKYKFDVKKEKYITEGLPVSETAAYALVSQAT